MHPLSWLSWLAAVVVGTFLTRNPLYLLLMLVICQLTFEVVRGSSEMQVIGQTLPISPVRFAFLVVLFGALFNACTSHVGETVLFQIPPALYVVGPLLGGPITGEALVYGAINGLVLAVLFAVFTVLSLVLPIRDLIAYLPRAFYPVAVVSVIAVTFIPNLLRKFDQVREAQAVRGHRMRGIKDWLPLFMPVLVGGLEQAMQLAEAMTARGFAHITKSNRRFQALQQLSLLGGLLGLLLGGVAPLIPRWSKWAPALLLGGVILVIWALWRAGRDIRRTRYRRPVRSLRDFLAGGCAILVVIALIIWRDALSYTPYPKLIWPPFDTRIGWILMMLMIPAAVASQRREE